LTGWAARIVGSARRWLAPLCFLSAFAAPMAAFAHASLIDSDPENGAELSSAPATLTLSFNEPVEPIAIRMLDRDGKASELIQMSRSGTRLVLRPVGTLGEGAHLVSWRVISSDGHPVGGSLTFWVGPRGSAFSQSAKREILPVATAIWVVRLVIDFGLFVAAGGAFFVAWIQPSRPRTRGPVATAAAAGLIALLALGVSIGLQGLDVLAATPSALATPGTWIAGVRGSFGWSVGIAIAALLLGALSLRVRGTAAKAASLLAMVGVGLAFAATGHAAAAQPRLVATGAVFLHAVSLAFWIGALAPLGFALAGTRDQAVAVLVNFSRWIPLPIVVLLASGIGLSLVQLPRWDALWTTDYGLVLSAKLALVMALLVIALWNRLRLTPLVAEGTEAPRRTMRKSIAAELVLVAVILGVVGLWRFTPPPVALSAPDDDFFTHLHTDKAMANVTVSPGHAGPIVITIQLETPDEQPLTAAALSVTLSNPQIGVEPATVEARRSSDGVWRATMAAPVAGRWTLGLGILISDFDKVSVEAPILLK
jgi:copper transport protein